jgi:hypothetical protein
MKYIAVLFLLIVVTVVSGCTQELTTPEALSWCVAGEIWSIDPNNSSEIVGTTMYELRTRCHITNTLTNIESGDELVMNFYVLDEEGNDVWIAAMLPEMGAKRAHIVNNQCIAGDCGYFMGSVSTT